MASQATSAARLSAVVPGATPYPAGTACFAVLPGLFLSAWFGVFVLVPFLPCHHCTGFSVSHCPLFYILSWSLPSPALGPVNVDVRILLCNLEPPPWKAELAGTLTTHQDQARFPLAHAASPCLVESVTLYRIFCYCLKHWGPGTESRPQPAAG